MKRLAGQSQVKIRAGPTTAGSILGSFSQSTSDTSVLLLPSLDFQTHVSGDFVSRPWMAMISTFASASFSGALARRRGTCAFCVVRCVAVRAGDSLVLGSASIGEWGIRGVVPAALVQEAVEVSRQARAVAGS